MSFHLTVTFSGIISFARHPSGKGLRLLVPRTLLGEYRTDGTFEPDGSTVHKAIDGSRFKRHYPRLNRGLDREEDRLRLLRNEEVAFKLEFENKENVLQEDFSGVVSLADIWGPDALDPDALQSPETSPLVCAHLDLTVGTVAAPLRSKWSIPGTLRDKGAGGDALVDCFATSVVWMVAGLKSASVETRPYDGSDGQSWDLNQTPGGKVALSVVNHCTEPWDKLPGPATKRATDEDFRWHYHLLSPGDRGQVVQVLGQSDQDLPVLFPVKEQCPGAGSPVLSNLAALSLAPALDENGVVVFLNPPMGGCVVARWF